MTPPHQSIIAYNSHIGEVKPFTDWFQIFERKNIFVLAGGAWANILFETFDSFKRLHFELANQI
jgi:hypothetical protein